MVFLLGEMTKIQFIPKIAMTGKQVEEEKQKKKILLFPLDILEWWWWWWWWWYKHSFHFHILRVWMWHYSFIHSHHHTHTLHHHFVIFFFNWKYFTKESTSQSNFIHLTSIDRLELDSDWQGFYFRFYFFP